MAKRTVLFYKKLNGDCPLEKFLDSLPSKAAQKVVWVLKLAQDLEHIPAKYFTKLSTIEDIWEFRIKFGSNIYRVFAFQDGKSLVLTHGFIKKTQKTPYPEIERAQKYRDDHFKEKGGAR